MKPAYIPSAWYRFTATYIQPDDELVVKIVGWCIERHYFRQQ